MPFCVTLTLCVALFSIRTSAHQLLMVSSDSEDCIIPENVQCRDGAPPASRRESYNSNTHDFIVEDEDDDVNSCTSVMQVPAATTADVSISGCCQPIINQLATGNSSGSSSSGSSSSGNTNMDSMFSAPSSFAAVAAIGDRQGKYSRAGGKGSRTGWLPHVRKLATAINQCNLSIFVPTCNSTCPNQGKCFETVNIRVIKCCLEESFGPAIFLMDGDGEFAEPTKITPNHTAVRMWWELAKMGRVIDDTGNVTSLIYKVNEKPVCLDMWAKLHGVPPTTASTIDRKLKQGDAVWSDTSRMAAMANRTLAGTLINASTAWWMLRLQYYEMITTRGVILYPRGVIWQDVYAEEFIPEMRLLGFNWKDAAPKTITIQVHLAPSSTVRLCQPRRAQVHGRVRSTSATRCAR